MKSQNQRLYPCRRDGRYYNFPHEKSTPFLLKSLATFSYSVLSGKRTSPVNLDDWVVQSGPLHTLDQVQEPSIIWIGHSSFLITIGGVTIITDPVFGGLSWFYSRIIPVGIQPENLPAIDFVVISHNHRDHMDEPSLMMLKARNPQITVLAPQGDAAWFIKRGFARVREYTWWDQESFGSSHGLMSDVRITFLPAIHWSQRGLFDKNRSLWGSWLIESNGFTIYFAGDTAYSDHFSVIAREVAPIDVALMPLGPCEPRRWISYAHVNPQEAGRGFLDLGARHCIPMHWGTFGLGIDTFDAPLILFKKWCDQHQSLLENKSVHCVKAGAITTFENTAYVSPRVENVVQNNPL